MPNPLALFILLLNKIYCLISFSNLPWIITFSKKNNWLIIYCLMIRPNSMFYQSRRINFIFKNILIFLLLLITFRIFFFLFFNSSSENYTILVLLKAFFIGIKFDLRLAVLLCFPHMILSLFPYANISNSVLVKQLSKLYNYIVIT